VYTSVPQVGVYRSATVTRKLSVSLLDFRARPSPGENKLPS
jgi:hypothetical protein